MEAYKNQALPAEERARDLLRRMTLREKVGQLNQRLYGFAAYVRQDGAPQTGAVSGGAKTCMTGETSGETKTCMTGETSGEAKAEKAPRVFPSEEFKSEVERWGGLGTLYGLYRADPWSQRDFETGLNGALAREAYNSLQAYTMEHSRFGIPFLLSSECPHGHQALDGYLLPVNLAMGAAFDPALTERAYRVCGRQLRAMHVDQALISMLDVLRDPRWGRSEECFGEDPYLAGRLAAAVVRGVQAEGVDIVAKHFAAQGETTGGVNASAARIGERELREIHFPAMEAAAKAGARGVMAAYNEIDGIPCHANRWLLHDVLRGEMGFDGIVMADGFAIDRLDFLHPLPVENGAEALNAGVDVSLWDEGFTHLEEAVTRGLVSEERIDEAVLRVLTVKFARGLFEHPFMEEDAAQWTRFVSGNGDAVQRSQATSGNGDAAQQVQSIAGEEAAGKRAAAGGTNASDNPSLELARESAVLLKNDGGVLPLPLGRPLKVALLGERCRDLYAQLGDYTPPVRPENGVTVEQGLTRLLAAHPEISLTVCVESASKTNEIGAGRQSENAANMERCAEAAAADGTAHTPETARFARALRLAGESDVTVLVLGGTSSRFGGVTFDKNGAAIVSGGEGAKMDCGEGVDLSSLLLPESQRALLRAVSQTVRAAGKRLVTVVMAGRPYDLTEAAACSDALLNCFYPGPWGGQAIAELLFGLTEPSGRLPVSLPRSAGRLPVYYNYRASYEAMHYSDGEDGPLYPFGFGLGYGEAQYEAFALDAEKIAAPLLADGGCVRLRFTVKNTAVRPVWAAPMLFISREGGSAIPRKAELKGFAKRLLHPGEAAELALPLTREELQSYDRALRRGVWPGRIRLELRDGGRSLWSGELEVSGAL